MKELIQTLSALNPVNQNMQKAVGLLKSYFTHCHDLAIFPVTEENVSLGIYLKGLGGKPLGGWHLMVYSILEEAVHRLIGSTTEKSKHCPTRKSFYQTLSEPLVFHTLDPEPFEIIVKEIIKVAEDMSQPEWIFRDRLN
jgi:hypothetical protein